jgi:hypothetical protein
VDSLSGVDYARGARAEGKLSVQWGQFNPIISKEDLNELMQETKKKGIL